MLLIRNKRIAKSLSQESLAQKIGIDRATISRYETGERNPPLLVAAKIAAALGCTVDELLDKQDAS